MNRNRVKYRAFIVILFAVIFSFLIVATTMLLRLDKNNDYLSMLMFFSLLFFGLLVGNVMALIAFVKNK